MDRISSFTLDGVSLPVLFVEAEPNIYPGVTCHVYGFVGDKNKDLAIVEIEPGGKTPAQEVLEGDRTIELYVHGEGTLYVVRKNGVKEVHVATEGLIVEVQLGDKMQWKAVEGRNLIFAEVCQPPYSEGRYKNLEEDLF